MVKESQQEETVKEREQRMGFGKKERERETDREFLLVVEQSLSWSWDQFLEKARAMSRFSNFVNEARLWKSRSKK